MVDFVLYFAAPAAEAEENIDDAINECIPAHYIKLDVYNRLLDTSEIRSDGNETHPPSPCPVTPVPSASS